MRSPQKPSRGKRHSAFLGPFFDDFSWPFISGQTTVQEGSGGYTHHRALRRRMAVSRPRRRGAGASRARRAVDRGAFTTRRFRACFSSLFFASLALAAPSRVSSEGTDAPVSTRDSLRDVPFEVTALVGFDARNSSVTSIPTTIGGSVEWLGGFQVAFPGEVPETGQSWNDFGDGRPSARGGGGCGRSPITTPICCEWTLRWIREQTPWSACVRSRTPRTSPFSRLATRAERRERSAD